MTDENETKERDTSPDAALDRLLAFAESHGEVYEGAVEDCATLRAAATAAKKED